MTGLDLHLTGLDLHLTGLDLGGSLGGWQRACWFGGLAAPEMAEFGSIHYFLIIYILCTAYL